MAMCLEASGSSNHWDRMNLFLRQNVVAAAERCVCEYIYNSSVCPCDCGRGAAGCV